MKVIEAPVYRSDDGLREFKSQDECIEYEKFILLRAIIHKHARGIVYQAEVANFILKAWSEISLAMQHNGEACAIESALQPGWRDIETPPGWKLVPICLTPEMREVLLMADRFTVGEVYIMLLAAAPKATK